VCVCPEDEERGGHDGFERPRGRVHLRRRQVGAGGPEEPGDAAARQQLPLPRAEAHRVRGLPGVPEARVGDPAQLPQGVHPAREYWSPGIGHPDIRTSRSLVVPVVVHGVPKMAVPSFRYNFVFIFVFYVTRFPPFIH